MKSDDPAEALGINDRAQLAEVDKILRDRKRREVMAAGVTLVQPETITIDAEAQIGMDTIVEPFAQILGKTKIGENCRVGACSILTDSTLADDVEIGAFTIVRTSVVESGSQVGPYARLRMENHVEAGAHVGNFVELKKTRLRVRLKASHLAPGRFRDRRQGQRRRGYHLQLRWSKKHRTAIGDGAFVGSNSTLVAPIEIGAGAYIAAGSVITHRASRRARPGSRASGKQRRLGQEAYKLANPISKPLNVRLYGNACHRSLLLVDRHGCRGAVQRHRYAGDCPHRRDRCQGNYVDGLEPRDLVL